MGACCAPPAFDLPPPVINTKDRFERWELSQPFARVSMGNFRAKLDLAHDDCGNKGFVTREHLAFHFNTPVWSELDNPDSRLVKFLETHMYGFNDKSKFSYESLMVWGILHTVD